MTNQQRADILLHHWQLLWPLNPADRLKLIDQIEQDYIYSEVLLAVQESMLEPVDEPIIPRRRGYMLGAVALNGLLWFGAIVVLAEILRP